MILQRCVAPLPAAIVVLCLGNGCRLETQIVAMKVLVAASSARATAIQATRDFDHVSQVTFRERFGNASTEAEIRKINQEVLTHNQKRDRAYLILDELATLIKKTGELIANKQVDLSALLTLAAQLPPILEAFGVKDPDVLGAFQLLKGG